MWALAFASGLNTFTASSFLSTSAFFEGRSATGAATATATTAKREIKANKAARGLAVFAMNAPDVLDSSIAVMTVPCMSSSRVEVRDVLIGRAALFF